MNLFLCSLYNVNLILMTVNEPYKNEIIKFIHCICIIEPQALRTCLHVREANTKKVSYHLHIYRAGTAT